MNQNSMSVSLCEIVHDVRMTEMDQQQKQIRIQQNQALKGVTWKESGIPTLTQQVDAPTKTKPKVDSYPDDFILDFDAAPVKDNGHRMDCTCRQCLPRPKSSDATILPKVKAEEGIKPLTKNRR